MNHILKAWPEPFEAVWSGRKTYEIRRNDRDYQVGDVLELFEWDPQARMYLGRSIAATVKYMTRGGGWGLPAEICVLGIRIRQRRQGQPSEEEETVGAAEEIQDERESWHVVVSAWLANNDPEVDFDLIDELHRAVDERAELVARCKKVEAALVGLAVFVNPSPSHRFDELASRFYSATGIMAPGKSVAAEMAMSQPPDDARRAAYEEWLRKHLLELHTAAVAALAGSDPSPEPAT